jgi:hypothetical protein
MTKTNLKTARPTGRAWAYLGATLGGLVSIAANIGHSYVPPTGAVPGWTPHSGAVVGAVFWPVALFFAVEIFARIAWPVGRTWFVLRWLGLLPVALGAAVVSYRHLSGLLAFYGEVFGWTEGDNTGDIVELKVGTQDHQHLVSIEPSGKGNGSTFALVYVHTRGTQGDI